MKKILMTAIITLLLVGGMLFLFFSNEQQVVEEVVELPSQAIIRGYFFERDAIDWGEVPVVCDTLVVTEVLTDSDGLIDEFRDLVEMGNTVNVIDSETDRLILNLSLDGLSAADEQEIRSSNPESQINLEINDSPRQGPGRGVHACFSMVDILNVEN